MNANNNAAHEVNAQANDPVAVASDNFHQVVMPISRRVGGKNAFSHFQPYGLPTLDMAIDGAPAPDSWKEVEQKEGEESAVISQPVYDNTILDYLQTALTQRIQGNVRSKGEAGEIPTTWVELFETSGGTKYPVQVKMYKEALAEYLTAIDSLTAEAKIAILSYTDTRKLGEAAAAKKDRLAVYFHGMEEKLNNELKAEVSSVIKNIQRALDSDPDAIEF